MSKSPFDMPEGALMGVTAIAAAVVAAKYMPELKFALVDGDDASASAFRAESEVPSMTEFQSRMAGKGLSISDTGAASDGAALATKTRASVPTFADLQQTMAKKGLSAEDILSAQTNRNWVNSSPYSDVYRIPGLKDFLLKVPRNADFSGTDADRIVPENNPAPNFDFGQAVARIGPAKILQRVPGDPYGVSWSPEFSAQELSDFHADDVRTAAAMPQEAYDHFAIRLKAAEDHRLIFDPDNPNNILVDRKSQLLRPIDFEPADPGEEVHATLNDMLYPLMEKPGINLPPPTGLEVRAAGLDPLQAEYRAIVDKSFLAAQKAGLTIEHNPNLDLLMNSAGVGKQEYMRMFQSLRGG